MVRMPNCLAIILMMLPIAAFAQGPASAEKDLLATLKLIDQYSTYTGDYNEDKLDEANDRLRASLLKYVKRLDVHKYSCRELRKEMYVVTSPDGDFRIYSWDMETGGTMHYYDCVIQYKGHLTNEVFARHYTSGGTEDPGAFYSQIAQVDIPLG